MPVNYDRPQSGYSDEHPPRSAYLPAHRGCEPVSEPLEDDVAAESAPDAEQVAE